MTKKKIIIAILVALAITAWIIGAVIVKSNHGANPFGPGKYPPVEEPKYELKPIKTSQPNWSA